MNSIKSIILVLAVIWGSYYANSQTVHNNKPSSASMMKGKGALSFKLNGQLHKSDTTQTKCWTTATVPLAMLWAKGENISISWQIQNMQGKGVYRIDNDSKGSLNFTIEGKTYWTRKTDGTNYLAITITGIKDLYNVKLLSGTFEGILEDKDGNRVQITDGRFTTEGI